MLVSFQGNTGVLDLLHQVVPVATQYSGKLEWFLQMVGVDRPQCTRRTPERECAAGGPKHAKVSLFAGSQTH